jgi:hypothetical protein
MVAPASWAAVAEIIPSPWPSRVLPGPKAIKKNPAVPIAATIPAKVAGTKALGSFLPEVCAWLALFSVIEGSTSVGEDRFGVRTSRACRRRVARTQKAAADLSVTAPVWLAFDRREVGATLP